MKLQNAIVVNIDDNNHPLSTERQKGRIQIRILPFMLDVPESRLPWYDPFFRGAGSTGKFGFNPPKVNSNILVYPTTDSLRHGYYLDGDYISGFFDYSIVKAKLDTVTELSESTYSKIHFQLLENDNLHFYHESTGESGFIHKSGMYTIYDETGNVTLHSSNYNLKLNFDGTMLFTGANNSKVEVKSSGQIAFNDHLTIDV